MKIRNVFCFFSLLISISLLTSCATIIGGSYYYAKVQVPNHPNAKIEYKGEYKGQGEASFKAKRKEASNFSVIITEDGCKSQNIDFTQRQFRGWAFAGTLIGWTGIYGGIPLPWGIAVDGITGAWWKPDINEKGVTKQDFNHYIYRIDYTDNQSKNKQNIKSKEDRLRELKQLLEEKLITKEDYEIEKNKILEE